MAAKIMLVDDDPLILESIGRALTRGGYSVETTGDVFGLPLRAGQFRPDLILLDYNLPGLNGDRLAESLITLRSLKHCVIAFHSAGDESILRRAVSETGAAGYITKGLPRADLLARVRELLELRQPSR